MALKKCTSCALLLPISAFYPRPGRPSGYSACKTCRSIQCRKWQKTPRGRQFGRASAVKHKYGVTVQQYNTMLEAQNGTCAICSGTNSDERNLAVDHDHKTGKVRGLLCSLCNIALAQVERVGSGNPFEEYLSDPPAQTNDCID